MKNILNKVGSFCKKYLMLLHNPMVVFGYPLGIFTILAFILHSVILVIILAIWIAIIIVNAKKDEAN